MSHDAPVDRLKRVKLALNDWIHCHAPDMCETYRVEETHKRIQNFGGTLYYIAKAVEDVEAVMAFASEKGTNNAAPQGSTDRLTPSGHAEGEYVEARSPVGAAPHPSQPAAEGTPRDERLHDLRVQWTGSNSLAAAQALINGLEYEYKAEARANDACAERIGTLEREVNALKEKLNDRQD